MFDIPAHVTLNELHDFLLDAESFDSLLHLQLVRIPSRSQDANTADSCDERKDEKQQQQHADHPGDGDDEKCPPPPQPTYSALLHFADAPSATAFVHSTHGKPYNSLEPERCKTGFVARVTFDEGEQYQFPMQNTHAMEDGSGAAELVMSKQASQERASLSPTMRSTSSPKVRSEAHGASASTSPSRAASPSLPSRMSSHGASAASLQLPPPSASNSLISQVSQSADPSSLTCPVCLDPVHPALCVQAETTPVITILCHHIFHLSCLSKWIPSSSSSSCPVCRYNLQPRLQTCCSTCRTTSRLWLCIICGHVGCSRYARGHAFKHFEESAHNYAMEIETQRVWDYVSDCYVHRLVRNKQDGKLVEFSRVRALDDFTGMSELSGKGIDTELAGSYSLHSSAQAASSAAVSDGTSGPISHSNRSQPLVVDPSSSAYASVKLEEYLLEYNYLLNSQLEQQRNIFQHDIQKKQQEMERRRHQLETMRDQELERKQELEAKVEEMRGTKEQQEKQLADVQASYATLQTQANQLKGLNDRLLADAATLRASLSTSATLYAQQQESLLAEQDSTIANLEEQIHDLRFFLDTQRKIDRLDRTPSRAGATLKNQLRSGKAQLQLIEVAPDEDDNKGRRMRKKRG